MPACATAGSKTKKADTAAVTARRMSLCILMPSMLFRQDNMDSEPKPNWSAEVKVGSESA